MLKVALIGYGGIAQAAHLPAYKSLEKKGKAKLVAACDIDEKKFTEKMAINIGEGSEAPEQINFYTDVNEMLEKETVDLIDICVPTLLHKPIAEDMLKRGYNVMCEKPMCRTYEDCVQLIKTEKNSKGKLMIAQCLRFFPEYMYLKSVIESGEFGKPISSVFRRMSAPPVWSWENWYMDVARSGGCMLDMHIHDIDMARYLFGEPEAVSCNSQDVYSGFDSVQTRLFYPNVSVFAIGDWSYEGTDFTADYRVSFEKASVICEGGKVTVYPRGGEKFVPELSPIDGYEGEIEFFADVIETGKENIKNPPESAATTLKLIETMRKSAENNGKKITFTKDEL